MTCLQTLHYTQMCLLIGLPVWLLAMLFQFLAVTISWCGYSEMFTMMQSTQDFLRSSFTTGFEWWSTWLATLGTTLVILVGLVLLALFGFAVRFVITLWPRWLAALGAQILACLLGAMTLREVFLHLLSKGHCKLQALPTGKTTPVVADNDVIQESVIIFDDIRTYGAAGHMVFLSHFHLFWHVDQYAWQCQVQM